MEGVSFAIFVVCFSLFATWLLTKLLFKLIYLKYKFKVEFNWSLQRLQLTNIKIVKQPTSKKVDANSRMFEISIDKLWLSSCFINRNINDRFLVGLSKVKINVENSLQQRRKIADNDNFENDDDDNDNKNSKLSKLLSIVDRQQHGVPFWCQLYLKYLGCLFVENLNISFEQRYEFFVNKAKVKFRPEAKLVSLKIFDLISKLTNAELFVNRLVLSSRVDSILSPFRLEIDNANLGKINRPLLFLVIFVLPPIKKIKKLAYFKKLQ